MSEERGGRRVYGIGFRQAPPPVSHQQVWTPGSVHSRAVRLSGSVLQVTAPTETFRASFAETLPGSFATRLPKRLPAARSRSGSHPVNLEPSDGEGCAQRAQPLPVVRARESRISGPQQSWLIERLWTHQAVGIIGGSPKSGKTWLALEMAVSVASGSPCFDTFPVLSPGPVLLYAAEDSAAALRTRVETLARLHEVDFKQLDVHIITVDSLRLDRAEHQDRLESTLAGLQAGNADTRSTGTSACHR